MSQSEITATITSIKSVNNNSIFTMASAKKPGPEKKTYLST